MLPSIKNTIKLDNLTFFAFHGVNKEEIEEGQIFLLDLTISYNLDNSSDSIFSTIDYIDLYKTIKSSFIEKRFNLLESLGNKLIVDIKNKYKSIYYIKINIKKPSIVIDSTKNFVNVEIEYKK
jgi:dihydroneopterin aldolase